MIDLWSAIFLGAALQAVFLAVALLFHKRGLRRANTLLAALVLMIAAIWVEFLALRMGHFFVDERRQIIFLTTPFFFLIGPVYYFYVQTQLQPAWRLALRHGPHALPALLLCANALPLYLQIADWNNIFFEHTAYARTSFIWVSGYTSMAAHLLQTGIYLFFAHRSLAVSEQTLKQQESGAGVLKLAWLRQMTTAFLAVLAVHVVAFFFLLFHHHVLAVEYAMSLSLAAPIFMIAWAGVQRPEVFALPAANGEKEKYQRSPLAPQQARIFSERLAHYMAQNKPHLRCDLKLPDLAKALGVSTNQLSQLLNQELHTNFFDFINQYRVREAQARLRDPRCQHLTTLAIAYESGFNSKASFNRVFKKYTGLSPSRFSKSRQENVVPINA